MNSTNEKTQHTPGPWRVESFDGLNQYAEVVAGDGISEYVRVCDIPSWPCATEEMKANANLLASAPQLLRFADSAVPLLYLFKALLDERWIDSSPSLRIIIEQQISTVSQVAKSGDAAIDKATGNT